MIGFMDKAKKLAEQAQQMLDEAQGSFNQSASTEQEPQPGSVRYDEHGRPIPQAAPPAEEKPAAPGEAPAEEKPAAPGEAPPAPGPDVNQTPDPFKPLR